MTCLQASTDYAEIELYKPWVFLTITRSNGESDAPLPSSRVISPLRLRESHDAFPLGCPHSEFRVLLRVAPDLLHAFLPRFHDAYPISGAQRSKATKGPSALNQQNDFSCS